MILFVLVLWLVGTAVLALLAPLIPLAPEVAALALQTYTLGMAALALVWIGLKWAAKGET